VNKETIYQQTVAQYNEWYGDDPSHKINGCCLYWALTGAIIFQRHGIRSIIQAGTMQWPGREDDGVNDTHFGYVWSPEREESQAALRAGIFPEIHIWLALPERGEIVDFSVSFLPGLAERDGFKWTLPPPPQYLWSTKDEMPEGVIYSPKFQAIAWLTGKLEADGLIQSRAA
jgi:hypothetical protein